MKQRLSVVLVLTLLFVNRCGGSAGSGSSSTSSSTTPSIAAVSKSTGSFGALVVNDQGESLMPMVTRDSNDTVTGISGALWSNGSGANAVVYLDATTQLPTQTVIGDFVYLFSNWNVDAQTVDVAVLYTPDNFVQAFKGVSVNPHSLGSDLAVSFKSVGVGKATCFPACESDTENLAMLIKLAGLGVSVGACGIASTISLGALALPCAGVIVTTATLVLGDETWLNNAEKTSAVLTSVDAFKCTTGSADSCITSALEIGSLMVATTDTTIADNTTSITTAEIFLQDPETNDRDVGPGGTIPSGCVVSSSYECTEGAFMPCFSGGTKTCSSSCTWGSCPASASSANGGTAANAYNGSYTGTYSGNCTTSDGSGSISGSFSLTISNGSITVSGGGGSGSGTIDVNGGSSFGAGGSGDVTYSFSGGFSESGSGSGSWVGSDSDTSCNGSWSATRH